MMEELHLSDSSDWVLYDCIADYIENRLGAVFRERIDGIDARYWDFTLGVVPMTLHLEHYTGICILSEAMCARPIMESLKASLIASEVLPE